jgi:hypothetical protein
MMLYISYITITAISIFLTQVAYKDEYKCIKEIQVLVYSTFISLVVSCQQIKLLKYIKLFWMISFIDLYYTNYVFEPLGHQLPTMINTNSLRQYFFY